MSEGRRKHSPAFKAKVAPRPASGQGLEVVKEAAAVAQLAARYQVHPSQIQAWKKSLTEGTACAFGDGQEQKAKSDAALIPRLYQEIGQLKVERDFLAERFGPRAWPSGGRWWTGSVPVRPVLPAQGSLR